MVEELDGTPLLLHVAGNRLKKYIARGYQIEGVSRQVPIGPPDEVGIDDIDELQQNWQLPPRQYVEGEEEWQLVEDDYRPSMVPVVMIP